MRRGFFYRRKLLMMYKCRRVFISAFIACMSFIFLGVDLSIAGDEDPCDFCCVVLSNGKKYSCIIRTTKPITHDTKILVPLKKEVHEKLNYYKGPDLGYVIEKYTGIVKISKLGKEYELYVGWAVIAIIEDENRRLGISDGRYIYWDVMGPIATYGASVGYEYNYDKNLYVK
jgi:hypothetical protein